MMRRIHSILLLFALLVGTAGMNYVQAANVTLTVTASPAAGGQVRIANGAWTTSTNGTTSRSVAQSTPMSISAQAASGYTFSKWSDGNTNATRAVQITKNTTYTATFIPNTVTLTLKTATGNTTQGTVRFAGGTAGASASQTFNYNQGVNIIATPATGYHFVQWSDGNKSANRTVYATSTTTYTATFAINQYTITFKNEDGTTLKTQTVNYNVKPTPPSNPTKAATAQYTYTFKAWSPTIAAATKDQTYTATYTATVRSYTIRFLNGSTVLQTGSVEYGTTPSYTGSTPTKSSTAQYTYTFSSWSPAIYAVNKAQDYTAQFTSTTRSYKITGKSADNAMGTVSGTATKQYGQTVTLTATPKDCYKFVQWTDGNTTNPRTVTVTAAKTYTATFEENIYSGTCGATGNEENVQWSLNMCTGTLSITGTGAMKDYNSNSTPWDSYRASIKSITIANGVTHIGSSSFHYCAATSVTIPSSVITIGDFAFFRCASLTSINIPSSVTTINFEAFMGCSSLTSVTIPNSVTGLGMGVFEDCTSLTSATLSNSITTIPSGLFEGCSALTSVKIPNGVTLIDGYAFAECSSLPSVTIPNSVTMLGYRVLYKCTSLKDIYVSWTTPDAIPEFPPYDMPTGSAIRLHIPCGTKSIYQAPYGWKSYTHVEEIADGTCGAPGNEGNVRWSLSCDSTLTISGTGEMADYMEGEAPWYPYREAIKYYILNGAEIANIGDAAFYNCPNLIGLLGGMPCTVKIVGKKAFMNCPQMKNFTLCSGDNTAIKDSAFYNCSNLGSFTLKGNIVHIGKRAFYNCTNLTTSQQNSITTELPKTITYIGEEAFYNCPNVNDLRVHWTENIPAWNNITNMDGIVLRIPCGTRALYDAADGWKDYTIIEGALAGTYGPDIRWTYNICDSTLVISGTGNMMGGSTSSGPLGGRLNAYKGAIKTIIIEEGVTNISDAAFSKCTKLTSVTIPNSVTSIGWASFYQCNSLKSITIPNSVVNLNYNNVFEQCYALTDLYFSWTENVPEYNSTIFRFSSAPKTIHIPCGTTALYEEQGWANSLCTLEDHVISGTCGANGDNLTWSLCTTDSTLTISGTGAMANYPALNMPWKDYRTSITSVIISEGVTTIGAHAFNGCSHLTSLTVPSSLTSVGQNAFTSCWAMESVYISDLEAWCNISFGTYDSSPFSRNGYSNYLGGGDLYVNGTKVTTLTIPDGITEIKNDAFYGFAGITSIDFNQVTSIGREAFTGCHGLTEVTIPEGVTAIGQYGFSYCSHLQSISIPASVSSLGTSMLAADNMLTDIHVQWTENIPVWPDNFTKKNQQSSITLHVPCGAEELYSAANGWKDYTIEGEGGPYTITVQTANPEMGDVSIVVN